MYDGYKQDWVGGLTDEHGKLAGFGEKRGAGGLEGLDLYWRRGTTRATTAAHPWGLFNPLALAARRSAAFANPEMRP